MQDIYDRERDDYIKRLPIIFGDLDVKSNRSCALSWILANSCVVSFQWILDTYPDMYDGVFTVLTNNCHSDDITEFLINTYPNAVSNIVRFMKRECYRGNMQLIKLIREKYGHQFTRTDMQNIFWKACIGANFQVIQYLLDEYPDIDIYDNNHQMFLTACSVRVHTKTIDVLVNVTRGCDISYHSGYFFWCSECLQV